MNETAAKWKSLEKLNDEILREEWELLEIARKEMERTAALRTAAFGTPEYRAARLAAEAAKTTFIAAYNEAKS